MVTRKNLIRKKSLKEFISSSGSDRKFAKKTALKRCRFFDRKSSGAAATATEKVAALVAPLCSSLVFDDVIACDLWFGPPPIKNPGYACGRRGIL